MDTITGAVEGIIRSAIEETIVSLKRERKGKRMVVIYFTISKPREDTTEEDAGDILNTLGITGRKDIMKADAVLRIGDTDFLIWVTFTKLGDVFYFDTMLDNIMHFSRGDYDKVQLQLDDMERLLNITYIIIPQGKVRADDVYELMKNLAIVQY